MIASGWANNCGTQLFTIGWVPCVTEEIPQQGGGLGGLHPRARIKYGHLRGAQSADLSYDLLGEDTDLAVIAVMLAVKRWYS